MSATLEVEDLVVSPGSSEPVVKGATFTAAAGDLVVVAGPSGAGKTTLLRAIAGLQPIDGGRLGLSGNDLAGVPAHSRRIAMVFQEPRLLPHLPVLDNVALPLRAAGADRSRRRQAAIERLAEVGLEDLSQRRVAGLSGGEQHRVALARALCGDPELLLLDEPLAALDPNRRENLRDLILEIQSERELTTVLVTHDRTEAAEMADSIALMIDGLIEQQDKPRTLFERPANTAVAHFFGTRNLLSLERREPEVLWAIRPEQIRLGTGGRIGRVLESSYRGSYVRVLLDWQGQELEVHTDTSSAPAAGVEVNFDLPEKSLWPIPRPE